MSSIKLVNSPANAPAKFPYSQAAVVDGKLAYLSGLVGQDAAGVIPAAFDEQVLQIFANMQNVLTAVGSNLENVVKVNVYLKSMDDFPKLNEIYGKFFSTHKPARTTVAVAGLPLTATVEIDCVAVVPPSSQL